MAGSYYDNASMGVAFLPDINRPTNLFELPYTLTFDFDADYLIPFEWYFVHPGDSINIEKIEQFVRLNPLAVPIMDMLYLETFAFWVPMRQVWNHTKNFFGEQSNPDESTEYIIPYLTGIPSAGFDRKSVFDYMGIPPEIPIYSGLKIQSLPFRAINKIYNRWVRNENLQDSLPDLMGDGPDNVNNFYLFKRAKRKDYITSCLPWTQKGPSVTISIPDFSIPSDVGITGQYIDPINGNRNIGFAINDTTQSGTVNITPFSLLARTLPGTTPTSFSKEAYNKGICNWNSVQTDPVDGSYGYGVGLVTNPDTSGIKGTLKNPVISGVPVMDITQFRAALQTQGFNETNARYGTRYPEFIYGHYGVRVSDYRVQDPELLAVSSVPLNFSVIPQTSSSDNTTPQGNLSAYGVFADDNFHFNKSFEEYGYVILMCNVRANLTYSQRLDRKFTYSEPLDLMFPEFAHLSEQPVYNYEVALSNSASTLDVFGYQENYAHIRYEMARLAGNMRPYLSQGLGVWTLSEVLDSSSIALNNSFIQPNTPLDRVLAVSDESAFFASFKIYKNLVSTLPLRGIPATFKV